MKELATKGFWRGVVKTFYQALEPPPQKPGSAADAEPVAAPPPTDNAPSGGADKESTGSDKK